MFFKTLFPLLLLCCNQLSYGQTRPFNDAYNQEEIRRLEAIKTNYDNKNKPVPLTAADTTYLLKTSWAVDPDRYNGIKGEPHLDKDFGPAILYDANGRAYHLKKVNFNRFSGRFDYLATDGSMREILPINFPRISILRESAPPDDYVWRGNTKFTDTYAHLVYHGKNITATRIYEMENITTTLQDVGKTLEINRFVPKTHNWVVIEGSWQTFKINNKKLAAVLDDSGRLLKYINQEDLDAGDASDLRKIFAKADELRN
jgi:hypothetical protein